MLKLLSVLTGLVFVILGVVLGLLNSSLVLFDYYFNQQHIPLSILLAVSFALGMVFAALFLMTLLLSLRWQLHKSHKQTKQQSIEIMELKKQLHKNQISSESTSLVVRN